MEYRKCGCGCGKTFIPNKPWQKFINTAHQLRALRARRKGEKKQTKKEKNWDRMKPESRWKQMTLAEAEKECLRLHITYGQAQVMAELGTLPKEFGKGLR